MDISTMFLAMFIACIGTTMILAFIMTIWIFDEADLDERNRRKREFHFIMMWMAILDFVTLIVAIISKIY